MVTSLFTGPMLLLPDAVNKDVISSCALQERQRDWWPKGIGPGSAGTYFKLVIVVLQIGGADGNGGTKRDLESGQGGTSGQVPAGTWYRSFELVPPPPISNQPVLTGILETVEASETATLHLRRDKVDPKGEEVLGVPELSELEDLLGILKVQVWNIVVVEVSPAEKHIGLKEGHQELVVEIGERIPVGFTG